MPELKKPSGTQTSSNTSGQAQRRQRGRGGQNSKKTAEARQVSPAPPRIKPQESSKAAQTVAPSHITTQSPVVSEEPPMWMRSVSVDVSSEDPSLSKKTNRKQNKHTSAFHVSDKKMIDLLERAGRETNNTFNPLQLKAQMQEDHFHSFMNLVKASIDLYIKDNQLDLT